MLNRSVITGRLTKDPVIRNTEGENRLALFTLAVDRNYRDENGDKRADFIQVSAFTCKGDMRIAVDRICLAVILTQDAKLGSGNGQLFLRLFGNFHCNSDDAVIVAHKSHAFGQIVCQVEGFCDGRTAAGNIDAVQLQINQFCQLFRITDEGCITRGTGDFAYRISGGRSA